ncbi:hypothetical protein ACROYT_G034543 [Oculina patagonica]
MNNPSRENSRSAVIIRPHGQFPRELSCPLFAFFSPHCLTVCRDNLSLPSQPVITRLVIGYLPLVGLIPIARERRWCAAELSGISQVV